MGIEIRGGVLLLLHHLLFLLLNLQNNDAIREELKKPGQ